MRKCYQQLVLFYLKKTKKVKEQFSNKTSANKWHNAAKIISKDSQGKTKDKQELLLRRETKRELRATWIACRAMSVLSTTIDSRSLLYGYITGLSIPKSSGEKIPLSVLHDLLGSVSISSINGGEIQNDGVITMNTFVNGTNTVQITWNHLLYYVDHLRRQVSYHSLGINAIGGALFRWSKLLKLQEIHEFLNSELDVYEKNASGVNVSPILLLPELPLKKTEVTSHQKGRYSV